jgi:hypothetical protein
MDTSSWGIIEDKPSIIEIIPPNTTTPIVHFFEKGENNIFNSSNLMLSAVGVYNDLPDGIYRITVKGSPDTNCKHRDYLKTDKTMKELRKLYINLGFGKDHDTISKKKELQELELLIRAAEAAVACGRLKKALAFFKRVVKGVNDYNDCETC